MSKFFLLLCIVLVLLLRKLNHSDVLILHRSTDISGSCPAVVMQETRDPCLFLRDGQLCQPSLTLPLRMLRPRKYTSSQVTKAHIGVFCPWNKFARGLNGWFGFISTGTKFWVYTGKSVLGPRSIEKLGLPSSVQKVEGALQKGKSKVLLFSGENFWR